MKVPVLFADRAGPSSSNTGVSENNSSTPTDTSVHGRYWKEANRFGSKSKEITTILGKIEHVKQSLGVTISYVSSSLVVVLDQPRDPLYNELL